MTTDDSSDFGQGIETGAWLEREARPSLARWRKSAEDRVRTQALILSALTEEAVAARDWTFLGHLRELWDKASAPFEPDGGGAGLRRRGGGPGRIRGGGPAHPAAVP